MTCRCSAERVQLDSITANELGDPDSLLRPLVPGRDEKPSDLASWQSQPNLGGLDWLAFANAAARKDIAKVCLAAVTLTSCMQSKPADLTPACYIAGLLNVVYDAMPSQYVAVIVTEFGAIPPTSVPVILREYRQEPPM